MSTILIFPYFPFLFPIPSFIRYKVDSLRHVNVLADPKVLSLRIGKVLSSHFN